jgi:hypothetical protein
MYQVERITVMAVDPLGRLSPILFTGNVSNQTRGPGRSPKSQFPLPRQGSLRTRNLACGLAMWTWNTLWRATPSVIRPRIRQLYDKIAYKLTPVPKGSRRALRVVHRCALWGWRLRGMQPMSPRIRRIWMVIWWLGFHSPLIPNCCHSTRNSLVLASPLGCCRKNT